MFDELKALRNDFVRMEIKDDKVYYVYPKATIELVEEALINKLVCEQDYSRVCEEKNILLNEFAKNSKKLKAIEIIKEIMPISEEDFFYDFEENAYFFIGYKVSEEKFDLLKEVFL